jgi:sphingomyelin phosphodiesterase acid-like 3
MVSSAFPQVPIYAALGNHDFYPPWGTIANDPGDFANFANVQTWLSESELDTFKIGGYFFHDFGTVRILFLNSVLYSTSRTRSGDPDPFGQFAWIEKVADEAKKSGMVIGTIMHIPSGVQKVNAKAGWYPEYRARYHNLTLKYDFQFA